MKKEKKLNKFKVGIFIFLIVSAISIGVFGRYVYNFVRDAYFTSQKFYFSSDRLTTSSPITTYTFNDWGGVDTYEVQFDLYSYQNEFMRMDHDLNYTVTCQSLSTDKVTCSLVTEGGATTATGTIYASPADVAKKNISRVKLFITPIEGANISRGTEVEVKVTAKTTVPYIKEISCKFKLKVRSESANTYSIEDEPNKDYAILKLVNASEATEVVLEFDPDELRLDLNDEIYVNNKAKAVLDSNQNVYKISFNMATESSKNIKFYKVDKTQDYTYTSGLGECAIDVTI